MRKSKTVPGLTATAVAALALLLAGCRSVSAPNGAASTTEPPASQATGLLGTCTPDAGSIAVLLPDSAAPRWEMDDRPAFEGQLTATGRPFTVVNAQGDPANQLVQAQTALVEGAKVLILASVDSETGAAIVEAAHAAGAHVIDYDRLTTAGSGADLYVSVDSMAVGNLMAQTLESQINNLGKEVPQVVQLNGASSDNNAGLVRAGYSSLATPYYDKGRWQLVADKEVPGWDAEQARQIFTQILAEAGDEGVDAVFAANDTLATSVVQVLKLQGRAPVLLSGQDATVEGIQNILAGWQTMTVYKPIQAEAAAAVVAALTLLNCEPVDSLNVTTLINNGQSDIPAILLQPVAVTQDNIAQTVIADGFRTWDEVCTGEYEQFCPPADQR